MQENSSPPSALTDRKERTNRTAVLLLAALGLAAFVPFLAIFFVSIVLAATFAALFYPMYEWLDRRIRRFHFISALICCLALVLVLLVPAYVVVHLVIDQAIDLYRTALPTVQQIVREGTNSEFIRTLRSYSIVRWILDNINIESAVRGIGGTLTSIGTTIVNRTYAGAFGLAFDLIIALFVMFYFLLDGRRIISWTIHLIPMRQEYTRQLLSSFALISRATIRGTLVIGLVQGLLGAITLLIFGVDSWLFWGFLMIILSVIPLLGPPIVLIPAGIIQILLGHLWQGIGIILSSLLVVSSVDNVLRPRLVGSGAKMHDLLIFFSTLGGLGLFGVTGFIIGPAIAAFSLTALKIYESEFSDELPITDASQKSLSNTPQLGQGHPPLAPSR